MLYDISISKEFSSGLGATLTSVSSTLGSKFDITVSISVEIGSMKSEFPNSNNAPVIRVPMSFLKNTSPIFVLTRFCTQRLIASSFYRGSKSLVTG